MSIFSPWEKSILSYADLRFHIIQADTFNFLLADYAVIDLLAAGEAEDFNDAISDIHLIKAREMKWKGKMSRFFFYDASGEGADEHWLVVSGPFNTDQNNSSFSEASSTLFSDEQYSKPMLENQITAIMEKLKKEQ